MQGGTNPLVAHHDRSPNAALDISSVNMYVPPYNCPLLLIPLPASLVNVIAADPSQHQDTGTAPDVVLGFERFLSGISARFIRARGEELDPLVLDELRSFTALLSVDPCTFTEVEPHSGHTFARFSYLIDGCTSIPPMRAGRERDGGSGLGRQAHPDRLPPLARTQGAPRGDLNALLGVHRTVPWTLRGRLPILYRRPHR